VNVLKRPKSKIGEILSLIRQELYLTQEELGNEMGFSRSRIAEIENTLNEETLPLETMFRIYYFANTLQNNIAMNDMIHYESQKLYDICDSYIVNKLKERCNNTSSKDKERIAMKENLQILKKD